MDYSYWVEAVSSIPEREMKFAYNVSIATLPTNSNLALWYRGQVLAQCKLCGYPFRTLNHILNKCEEALYQHRLDPRHDSVLSVIHTYLTSHLTNCNILANIPGKPYTFPIHIAATSERPDIIIWNDEIHSVTLIELTIPFEDNFFMLNRERSTATMI